MDQTHTHKLSCGTYWMVVTVEDDASGVEGRGTAPVSVQVNDADGAVLNYLRAGLDVSQVVTPSVDHAAGPQRTHCRVEKHRFNLHLTKILSLL